MIVMMRVEKRGCGGECAKEVKVLIYVDICCLFFGLMSCMACEGYNDV